MASSIREDMSARYESEAWAMAICVSCMLGAAGVVGLYISIYTVILNMLKQKECY